jgi:hypothetical protein
MEFTVKYCNFCQAEYIECPKCGNNCCNGGNGIMDMDGNPLPWNDSETESQPCDICSLTYQHQDLYWQLQNFCTCDKKCTCEYVKNDRGCYTGEMITDEKCPVHGSEDKKPKADPNCPVHKGDEVNEMPKHLEAPDIEFEFYPNASEYLYMEDVTSMALEAFSFIEERLKKFGIEIQEGQDDDLFLPIERTIERYGNGEYRSHM